jgi:hypothetical protein
MSGAWNAIKTEPCGMQAAGGLLHRRDLVKIPWRSDIRAEWRDSEDKSPPNTDTIVWLEA